MKTYLLERTQMIPRSRSETFAFFSEAFNLEHIFDYRAAMTARLLGAEEGERH